MSKLSEFFNNKGMNEEVKNSLDLFMEKEIIKRVFDGKSVDGYKEAKDVYKNWMSYLSEQFSEKKVAKKKSEFFDSE